MRTALISDIHAHHPALLATLADIARSNCDRTICLGDIVEGGAHNTAAIHELITRNITTVRGNHDDLYALTHPNTPEAAYLAALPTRITEATTLYTHISPLDNDRPIKDRYAAWSVLDDTSRPPHTPHHLTIIGHAHLPLFFSWLGSTPGAARRHPIVYDTPIPLDPADRYILCPGSIAPGRDDDPAPRYAIHDAAARTIEFRRVV